MHTAGEVGAQAAKGGRGSADAVRGDTELLLGYGADRFAWR
jgi:hypothetical protein